MASGATGDEPSEPSTAPLIEVRYEFTPILPQILEGLRSSLMVTTYQAGKLLVLGVHDGQLKISFNSYDQPMGLAIDGQRMALGTRRQIHSFHGNRDVAPTVEPQGTFDVCYIPRDSASTGSIHGHDLAWGQDGLWVVNTLFSCICTLHEEYSFVPRWKPPFISDLIDQDRCHLNGLAVVEGAPRFVTAMSETDTAAGWRPTKATSGVVMEMQSGETIARGLSMPHSPRWYDGQLWVLDSGYGALCTVDLSTGQRTTVATFPGYTRGLSFAGQFAFVGLSKIRETSVFGGVPIAEHRHELKCGVGVVDITTGRTVAVFQFLSGVTEIFAVEIASDVQSPLVAGASSEGTERDVWIVPSPGTTPGHTKHDPWYARKKTATSPPSAVPAAQRPADPTELESWVEAHPEDATAWITLGNLRQEQARQRDALYCYERAADADHSSIPARQNLGYLQFNLGMPDAARETYRELVAMAPTAMNRLLAASVLPITYDSTDELEAWRSGQRKALQSIAEDELIIDATTQLVPTAFFWAYQGQNDIDVMKLRGRVIRGDLQLPTRRGSTGGPLRVGFLSAYFRDHTIGRLNIGRIEQLNRDRFHVTVCMATAARDAYAERFRAAADTVVDVPRDVPAAIRALRAAELDVLIFCDVGMDALCSTLAFSRMAPVQCVTWGHPETTGSDAIDYFLSSEDLDHADAQGHYSETLVRMPLSGTYYARPKTTSHETARESFPDLAPHETLYCCPQSLFKFHPDMDVLLRGILERDREGVIVGIEGRVPEWTNALRTRWRRTLAGMDDRIRLLPAIPNEEYLKLLAAADVVLDPIHFGGGNSSYESFACGTPIVTLPGEFLRSRITAALYRRMGLESLVATSADDYVDRAVSWAADRAQNEAIRSQIAERSDVLFENPDEVRCLEDTLQQLLDRQSQ